jgi:ribonuclease HI
MPWKRHRLRDADVWAKTDASGVLVQDSGGRVEIVYKSTPGQRVYRAGARNLSPAPGDNPLVEISVGDPAPESTAKKAPLASAAPANAIHVWTDGACTGNPGPAGLGVVVIDGEKTTELSEYLGEGTNNIAELTAIQRGLETVADRARPVLVYTDSQYSIGVVSMNWKAKANVELVGEIRSLCKQFKDLKFVKVAGHAGIALNERVDELARNAVTRRS